MLVNTKQESSKKRRIIVTECPDKEDCPILYTDIFGLILIECRDPKHADTEDIEKVEGMDKLASQTKPQQQIGTSNLVPQQDSGALRD